MAQISKNVLLVLVFIAVVISLMGSVALMSAYNAAKVPVQAPSNQASGKVTVYVTPKGPTVTQSSEAGKVTVKVI